MPPCLQFGRFKEESGRRTDTAFRSRLTLIEHLLLRKGKPPNPRRGWLYVATTMDLESGSTESDPLHLTQI
jgi:hypothetical protein